MLYRLLVAGVLLCALVCPVKGQIPDAYVTVTAVDLSCDEDYVNVTAYIEYSTKGVSAPVLISKIMIGTPPVMCYPQACLEGDSVGGIIVTANIPKLSCDNQGHYLVAAICDLDWPYAIIAANFPGYWIGDLALYPE